MNLQGHSLEMMTWLFVALPLMCLDSAGVRVWLSCQAIIWITVLAGLLFWVFANQVTFKEINVAVFLAILKDNIHIKKVIFNN